VCSGTFPSRYHSEREISAPFNRPEQRKRILPRRNPLQPAPLFSWPGGKRFDARFAAKRFRDQLRVQLGRLDLLDVDLDLFACAIFEISSVIFSISAPLRPMTMPGRAV